MVKGTFQVLNSSIGKKDKEEGRAENMNVSSIVLQLLWGFTRRIIDNQWRFFVVGVHGLAILDPIDGRSAIKEENFLRGFQKWVAGTQGLPAQESSIRRHTNEFGFDLLVESHDSTLTPHILIGCVLLSMGVVIW